MKKLTLALSTLVLTAGLYTSAHATGVTPNLYSYTYTVTSSGNVVAYYVGQSAWDTDYVGLHVNGVDTGALVLNNQTSATGDSYNFGHFNAGDTLTFKLYNESDNRTYFSDAALNPDGQVHIQTSQWTAQQGIPVGLLVAFEDRIIDGGPTTDYNDAKYVFTNVTASPVPVPGAIWLFGSAMLGFLGIGKKKRAV